jgi:hypothetical protein
MFPMMAQERPLTEEQWREMPFSRRVNHVMNKSFVNLANRSKWWVALCVGMAFMHHPSLMSWFQLLNPIMM